MCGSCHGSAACYVPLRSGLIPDFSSRRTKQRTGAPARVRERQNRTGQGIIQSVRYRGVLLVAGLLLAAAAAGMLVVLSQRPSGLPPQLGGPFAVAKTSEVSRTPLAVEVKMQRGADRVLQRRETGLSQCTTQTMGCPPTLEVEQVTVLLVRDDADVLHAFVGEDPRNGCRLEWLASGPGLFHDVCHGSIYDRTGVRVGGPSPWNLNELATSIRGDVIWVEAGHFIVGECPGCPS